MAKKANPNVKDQNYKKGKGKSFEKDSSAGGRYRNKGDASRIGSKEPRSYDDMCTNDIGWYNRVTHLYNDATRIPFALIQGKSDPSERQFGDEYEHNPNLAVPGIMSIRYVPGIGVSKDSTSAANRAFQNIYAEISAKTTSGNIGFLPANLGIVICVEQSIAQNIAVAKRALKSVGAYHGTNIYYPRALLKAQGFDFDDLNANIANYRWRLNNIIRNYNSLYVPNFIDTFKRQYFLASNIFADGTSAYSQLYLFNPQAYYMYNDVGVSFGDEEPDGVARAESHNFPTFNSFGLFLSFIESQLDSLRNSSDWALINGTLLRTYSDNQFIRIDELGEQERLTVLSDPVMSYQIHNLTVAGWLVDRTASMASVNARDIYADYEKNAIIYRPRVEASQFQSNRSLVARKSFVLNTFEDSVDPAFIMESTRLMVEVGTRVENDSVEIISCGTEFVSDIEVYSISGEDPNELVMENNNAYVCNSVVDYGSGTGVTDYLNMRFILALSKFHKAPRFTVIYGASGDTPNVLGVTGDLYFYTDVPVEQVRRLHDTALLSIFAAHD